MMFYFWHGNNIEHRRRKDEAFRLIAKGSRKMKIGHQIARKKSVLIAIKRNTNHVLQSRATNDLTRRLKKLRANFIGITLRKFFSFFYETSFTSAPFCFLIELNLINPWLLNDSKRNRRASNGPQLIIYCRVLTC